MWLSKLKVKSRIISFDFSNKKIKIQLSKLFSRIPQN